MLNLALAAALLAPQAEPAQPAVPESTAAQVLKDMFPAPSGPMTLVTGDAENPLTFADLVKQYGELTGQHFVVSDDTQGVLHASLNLDRTMTVPAEEVQSVFEQLLSQGDFVLKPLTTKGTRIMSLMSLGTAARANLRSDAIFLDPSELHLASQHPALLFTTNITLPNLDVRQVSNSLRTMITDANTQQLLPAGNSDSMIIVGFGDQVAGLARTLRTMDDAASAGAGGQQRVIDIVHLENGSAGAVASILQSAYALPEGAPGFATTRFTSDPRTNSIVVTSRADDLENIKGLIAVLDVK